MSDNQVEEIPSGRMDQGQIDRANQLYSTLMKTVNEIGGNKQVLKSLIHRIAHEAHPTLQQGLMREFLKPLITEIGNKWERGEWDARNEQTVHACRKMHQTVLLGSHFPPL